MENKLSYSYKFLKFLGLNYSESAYGNISLILLIKRFFGNIYHALLLSMMNWVIFEPINPRMLRPFLLRRLGCKVGKGVFIGDHVRVDLNHANQITIEDNVHIASGSRLLCHQRNLTNYHVGDNYSNLDYVIKKILLKRGCLIGMDSFVLPGVTVGEGSIIGAGSLITKDIPDWVIASGRPAQVLKKVQSRL